MTANSCGTELLEIISDFNFEQIPPDWTQSIWNSNFHDVPELSDDILEDVMDSESLPRILNNCSSKCRRHLMMGGDEAIWKEMTESGYLRSFIAYLCHLIACQKNAASSSTKRNALLAADIYVSLCAVKGASAYHVFNAVLFQKSLEALKSACSHSSESQRRAGQNSHQARSPSPGLFGTSDAVDETVSDIGTDELTTIVRNFLKTVWLFVGRFDLSNQDESVEALLSCLCRLLRLNSDGNDSTVPAEAEYDLSNRSPIGLAFAIFHKIFDSEDNDWIQLVTKCTFKNLLPYLLMVSDEGRQVSQATIPAGIIHLRDLTMKFMLHLVQDKGDVVSDWLFVILQHLCAKVTDRAEYRTKVSHAVVTLAQELPDDKFQLFLEWLSTYSRNQKGAYRTFALDVVLSLFTTNLDKLDRVAGNGRERAKNLLGLCLQVIVSRCSDRAPTVRGRALSALGQIMEDTVRRSKSAMDHDGEEDLAKELLRKFVNGLSNDVAPDDDHATPENHIASGEDHVTPEKDHGAQGKNHVTPEKDHVTLEQNHVAAEQNDDAAGEEVEEAAGRIPLPSLLLRRCEDEKIMVRKSAIQSLELLIDLFPNHLNEEVVVMFEFRCMDTAVSVRKQALEGMTSLLVNGHGRILEKSWLISVLPCINDREAGVQEKCVDAFRQAVYDQLGDDGEEAERAWRMITMIIHDSAMTRYTQRILKHILKQNAANAKLIRIIERATMDESRSLPAWFLLSELANSSNFDLRNLQTVWRRPSNGNVFNYIMKIVAAKSKVMTRGVLEEFDMEIKGKLVAFSLPTENIAESLSALYQVALMENKTKEFFDWCEYLGQNCVDYLSPIVFKMDDGLSQNGLSQRSDEDTVRRLFLLGDIFQLRASTLVNHRNFCMVVALVAAEKYAELIARSESPVGQLDSEDGNLENLEGGPTDGDATETSNEARTTGTIGEDSTVGMSSQDIGTSSPDAGMASQDTGTSSQSSTIEKLVKGDLIVSPLIRSHAIIALGKLCLQNEAFAKKTVAILVALLESATDFAHRNNIVIVLSDLCLRYTSLIDRHIGRISRRLRDPSPLVRKQTLTLITNLLKEDYLKWRGALLFRFLTGLLDTEAQIRAFAEYCLVNILTQREPAMFYLHFLECLFYFNDARHPLWHSSVDMEGCNERKEEFDLAGKTNRERRLYLYRFMLCQLNDEQRFQLSVRITQEVLGGIVDELVPLDDNSKEIVADSLIILASKEMKLTSLEPASSLATDDLTDEERVALAVAEATKKRICQTVKQTAMEQIVPTLMSLKIMLQRRRYSGLERLLIIYLAELMKEYKKEMEEMMAGDKTLFKEVEYELKRSQKKDDRIRLPANLA